MSKIGSEVYFHFPSELGCEWGKYGSLVKFAVNRRIITGDCRWIETSIWRSRMTALAGSLTESWKENKFLKSLAFMIRADISTCHNIVELCQARLLLLLIMDDSLKVFVPVNSYFSWTREWIILYTHLGSPYDSSQKVEQSFNNWLSRFAKNIRHQLNSVREQLSDNRQQWKVNYQRLGSKVKLSRHTRCARGTTAPDVGIRVGVSGSIAASITGAARADIYRFRTHCSSYTGFRVRHEITIDTAAEVHLRCRQQLLVRYIHRHQLSCGSLRNYSGIIRYIHNSSDD